MSTKTLKMKMRTIHRKLKEQQDARKAGIYLRWIHTRDMPGSGIKTRLVCEKAAADELHLMSEAEHAAFLEAWWRADVETIFDHQALDRGKTQRAALCINIDHPTYIGRTEPAVLSTDLVLNVRRGRTYKREAISVRSARTDGRATLTRTQLIERRTWEDDAAIFKAVAFHGMHKNRSKNLAWIFRAHNDTVGRQLSASELTAQSELMRILKSRKDMRVVDACRYVDSKFQLPSGSGVQAFRQLAGRKALAFDLNTSDPVRLLTGDVWKPKRPV
ncbi:TnsA endonuclease C-terminal domain-containing protein [Burkholderia sp. Ac-20365]|uniref:TnsA endonuclease C-terminal domain-containing protein n=1 Tax=Burkholderia sp. Ac-20365 TaxID=2703897 RepID=UPI00197C5A62|nr:TnsA endonuclease C-terminal domain-containing protein [Burkholderia sp. Ac-20365]MBN3762019.1 heteromeric transposase endonuclease subunit TnsA [Burkholderia sp. Ac-20365]